MRAAMSMRAASFLVASALVALLPGCQNLGALLGDDEASSTGGESDAQGYSVEGRLEDNTCGSGSLALSDEWDFDVAIRRTGQSIAWEDTPAELADDGVSFTAEAQAFFDVRGPEDAYLPPCTIVRSDRVEGRFDDASDPSGFEGTFLLSYAPTEGSDCTDLLEGPERLVGFLPCEARYVIEGKRR
jgi:hypothetical protein